MQTESLLEDGFGIAEHGGTPVAANPDKFLSRIAKQRGWQTLNLFRIEEPSYMEVVEKTP